MILRGALAVGMLACLLITTTARAEQFIFTSDLTQLNNSNVTGNAVLTYDTVLNSLAVEINALNLEPDEDHVMHIHGTFDGNGNPTNATNPTLADDTDGDGFIELEEGRAQYGPIILPLGSVSTPTGVIAFMQTYDLTDSGIFATGFSSEDLFPLNFREIVLHGKTVADGIGAGTGGEVDGTGGYKAVLPVASGEIVGVPEPSSILLAAIAAVVMAAVMWKATPAA